MSTADSILIFIVLLLLVAWITSTRIRAKQRDRDIEELKMYMETSKLRLTNVERKHKLLKYEMKMLFRKP